MVLLDMELVLMLKPLNFAVLDQDKSPTSQNYIQNISGSRYFIEKDELSSFEVN